MHDYKVGEKFRANGVLYKVIKIENGIVHLEDVVEVEFT